MIQDRKNKPVSWSDKREALIHLTKDGQPRTNHPTAKNISVPHSAWDKLEEILKTGVIRASLVNHMDSISSPPKAVAFSEALPATILDMVNDGAYSGFGIMIHKESAFNAGGGPVWYVNNEYFKAYTGDANNTLGRVIPFDPNNLFLLSPYAPFWSSLRSHPNAQGKTVSLDFTYEREWRVPDDFKLPPVRNGHFDYHVIVPDASWVPKVLAIGVPNLSASEVFFVDASNNSQNLPHVFR